MVTEALRAERDRLRRWRRASTLVTLVAAGIAVPAPVAAGGLLVVVVLAWSGCRSLRSTLRAAERADWRMVHGRVRAAGDLGTRRLFVLELATGERGELSRGLGIRGLGNQEGQLALGEVPGRGPLVVAYGNSRILRFTPAR